MRRTQVEGAGLAFVLACAGIGLAFISLGIASNACSVKNNKCNYTAWVQNLNPGSLTPATCDSSINTGVKLFLTKTANITAWGEITEGASVPTNYDPSMYLSTVGIPTFGTLAPVSDTFLTDSPHSAGIAGQDSANLLGHSTNLIAGNYFIYLTACNQTIPTDTIVQGELYARVDY